MINQAKINVLFVARKFPPSVGGMERYAYDLSTALSEKNNLTLIKWGGSNYFLPFVLPAFFIISCWKLLTSKIDVIHIQDGLQAPMGLIIKTIFRKPLIIVIHGLDVTYKNKVYQKIVPWALKRADKIICISNAARQEVLKRGVETHKALFIPLGITDDLFIDNKEVARDRILKMLNIEKDDTKIILSTGRLVKRKGVAWFIENVMPELIKQNKKIILVISGDGEERENIEKAITKKHLYKYVHLLGRTPDNVLKDLYNGSDLFIMPNITVKGDIEGFGRVLLEASLCELPVIASSIEGIKDAISNNNNGILIEEKDTDDYVDKIIELFGDNKRRKKFGKNSRKYTINNYNWNKISDKFGNQYKALIRIR